MDIKQLLAEAAKATPTPPAHAKYTDLFPVVDKLLAQGFKLTAAVRWLIEKGQVSEDKRDSFYRCIWQRQNRAKQAK